MVYVWPTADDPGISLVTCPSADTMIKEGGHPWLSLLTWPSVNTVIGYILSLLPSS